MQNYENMQIWNDIEYFETLIVETVFEEEKSSKYSQNAMQDIGNV